MSALSNKLAQQVLSDLVEQERLDLLAEACIPTVAELLPTGLETRARAVRTNTGWTASVWCYTPTRPAEGFQVLVKGNCRTQRIALITANYFRLHTIINQFRNLNDSFSF